MTMSDRFVWNAPGSSLPHTPRLNGSESFVQTTTCQSGGSPTTFTGTFDEYGDDEAASRSLRYEVRRPIVRRRGSVLGGFWCCQLGKFGDRFRRREVSTQPITGRMRKKGTRSGTREGRKHVQDDMGQE